MICGYACLQHKQQHKLPTFRVATAALISAFNLQLQLQLRLLLLLFLLLFSLLLLLLSAFAADLLTPKSNVVAIVKRTLRPSTRAELMLAQSVNGGKGATVAATATATASATANATATAVAIVACHIDRELWATLEFVSFWIWVSVFYV